MKKITFVLVAFFTIAGFTATESCKSKTEKTTVDQPAESTTPVEISSDDKLRTSVNDIAKNYGDVKAEVNDGVVTLTGTVKQDELQNLIMKVQELKPKKVENKLTITIK